MADFSEPIRKPGCILNFQTNKLQSLDRHIVSSQFFHLKLDFKQILIIFSS